MAEYVILKWIEESIIVHVKRRIIVKKLKQLISRVLGGILAVQCIAGGSAAAAAVSLYSENRSEAVMLTAENEIDPAQIRVEQTISSTSVQLGETIEVSTRLFSTLSKAYITDTDTLSQMTVICVIVGDNGTRELDMSLDDDGKFRIQFSFPDAGDYFVITRVNSPELGVDAECLPVTLTVTKMKPSPISDINLSVRSKPLHTSEEFLLSSYVKWNSDEMVSVSVEPASSDYFTVGLDEQSGDVHFVVSGVKSGSDTVDIIVTDSSGASCTVKLQVQVKNGLLPIILIILVVCVIVVGLVVLLRMSTRSKLNGAVLHVLIRVPSRISYLQPVEQEFTLPKRGSSVSLYQAMYAKNNARALRSLSTVIEKMELDELLRNIRIRARNNHMLSLKLYVKNGTQTVNGRTITGTTEFSLGSGRGAECIIQCVDDGELVITY